MELALLIVFSFVVLVLLVRSKIRGEAIRKSNAHKNSESLIEANTFETGHSHSYYVTKDPVSYARIFVPDNAKE